MIISNGPSESRVNPKSLTVSLHMSCFPSRVTEGSAWLVRTRQKYMNVVFADFKFLCIELFNLSLCLIIIIFSKF